MPSLCAASSTSGSRAFSGDVRPHHETAIASMPARLISSICADTTSRLDDEYTPASG
jgi:hypothetical protein